jgi:hypothetical protein
MRILNLLPCLALAACASGHLAGGAAAGPASPSAAAYAQAAAPETPPASGGDAAAPLDADQLTQARVDCWMKVERDKVRRNIDQRIVFVDKCVADAIKAGAHH